MKLPKSIPLLNRAKPKNCLLIQSHRGKQSTNFRQDHSRKDITRYSLGFRVNLHKNLRKHVNRQLPRSKERGLIKALVD